LGCSVYYILSSLPAVSQYYYAKANRMTSFWASCMNTTPCGDYAIAAYVPCMKTDIQIVQHAWILWLATCVASVDVRHRVTRFRTAPVLHFQNALPPAVDPCLLLFGKPRPFFEGVVSIMSISSLAALRVCVGTCDTAQRGMPLIVCYRTICTELLYHQQVHFGDH
jgi:hypothetical protein